MKKILFPMMIAAVMLAACKPEAKPDASQDPAPVSQDPEKPDKPEDPSEGPVTPGVTGKVVLNNTTGFDTFASALESAKLAKEAAVITLSAGVLEENIVIDENVTFPLVIDGKTGAVLDGSIEISKAEVSIKNFTIKPAKTPIAVPSIAMKDGRNNYPFAVFVHDAKYGFNMENMTVDISGLVSADKDVAAGDATALVLRGETIGSKDGNDVVRNNTFMGKGHRLIQAYDAQVNLLGNTFTGFYKSYAIRMGEDAAEFFDNEVGTVATIAGNNFIADEATAAINFYSLFNCNITFGNGTDDTNRKSEGVEFMYTVNTAPGGECVFVPDMLVDEDTKELYPANDTSMPEVVEVWAYRAGDSWWGTDPLPGLTTYEKDPAVASTLKGEGSDWLRAVAMDNEYVYIARTITDLNNIAVESQIYYFPIGNPTEIKTLKTPANYLKDRSTFAFSGLYVVDNEDGSTTLLVGNCARESEDEIFKVWKYDSVTSEPELLVSHRAMGGLRIGDRLGWNGTMQDGEVLVPNYYQSGRIWMYPIVDGKWTGEELRSGFMNHPASSMSQLYRYFDSDEYIHAGSGVTNVPTVWNRIETTSFELSLACEDGQFDGMFGVNFFKFGRAYFMAYTSLKPGVADKTFAGTVRLIKIDKKLTLKENIEMLTQDSGAIFPLGQPNVTNPLTDDTNANGNQCGDCRVRTIDGNTYILASDCNNAIVLYRLKK